MNKRMLAVLAFCLPILIFAAAVSAADANGCWDGTSGAVALIRLDDAVGTSGPVDSCQSVRAGTWSNSSVINYRYGGLWNYSISLAGVAYAYTADDAAFNMGVGQEFSIRAIARYNDSGHTEWVVEKRDSGGTFAGISLAFAADGIYCQMDTGATTKYATLASVAGNWYDMVCMRNGTNISLWVNGSLANSLVHADVANNIDNANSLRVGTDFAAGEHFTGLIDDVRWYNYTLSALEISNLYAYDDLAAPSTDITFTRDSQTPADLVTFAVVDPGLSANYTITNGNGTVAFYHKTNDSTSDQLYYVNGTLTGGWTTEHTTLAGTYGWHTNENGIYPASYNYNETTMEGTAKSAVSCTTSNQWARVQLLNVSSSKQYGYIEWMANRTAGALPFWYCNSSYSTGSPSTSGNCAQFGTAADGTAYNHTHGANSFHQAIPFTIVSGKINSVAVTDTSYLLVHGSPSNTVKAWYAALTSRPNAAQSSTNDGSTWTNVTGTFDAHIHQFNLNTTFYYKAEACNATACYNDTTTYSDDMGYAPLPPNAPSVTAPVNNTHYNGIVNVTWNNATSPTNATIDHYNIYLYFSNLTLYQNLSVGVTGNNYTWDSSALPNEWYVIGVEAVDSANRTDTGFSGEFYVDTVVPVVTIFSPGSGTTFYTGTTNYINVQATDAYMFNLSCDVIDTGSLATVVSYKNDTGTGTTFTLVNEFTSALPASSYNLSCSAMDSHTAAADDGSINQTGTTRLDLVKNGETKATVTNSEVKMSAVKVEKLEDRNKITYQFSAPLTKFTETVTSKYPIYVMEKTGIPCHIVFGNRWYDAADAVRQGWTCSVTRVNDYSVTLNYASKGLSTIDPATGGLNSGYASILFTVMSTINASVAIETEDFTEYTNRTCVNNETLRYTLNKTITVTGVTYTYTQTKDVHCDYGCTGEVCQESFIIDGGPYFWLVLFIVMLFLAWKSVGRFVKKGLRV